MHGGTKGFDKAIWNVKIDSTKDNTIILDHVSPDGDSGYPGKSSSKKNLINDLLAQNHNPARRDHYFHLKLVLFCDILKKWKRTGGRVKIVISTSRDCGSAEWVNKKKKQDRSHQ